MRGEPRFDHRGAERVGAGPLAHHRPPARSKVGLLGDPSQHGDPVLERRGVPALGREAVPDGHDDGVAEAGHAAAECVVGGAVRGARHECAPMELHDHRQLPPRGGPRGAGGREVPAVVARRGRWRGRGRGRDADGVEAGAGASGELILARRGIALGE